MKRDLIEKYSAPVPRYTSYPTAPHFHDGITAKSYADWMGELPAGAETSLYFHIPFCDTLCWFCGCSTKIVRRYDPVASYLPTLHTECASVAARLPGDHTVTHIHWGGGSPDILEPGDIRNLAEHTHSHFNVAADHEFAVEIDPRGSDEPRARAFADAGITRLSIGVQDFDARVQDAINRHQPFEITRAAVDRFRQHGVHSVNMDLIYGLPYQTLDSIERTARDVLSIRPDRLAIFGYAHLPSRIKHQRMIPDEALPGPLERFRLAEHLTAVLEGAGYVRVGLDHFALPDDALARSRVHRNFQGYTTDTADCLIGLGASSISSLPHGYVQNAVPMADYSRRIADDGLATARGYAFTPDDRMRGFAIERLMCELRFPGDALRARFGDEAAPIIAEAEELLGADIDGLVAPSDNGFSVTEQGRPFLRTICAHFDRHFQQVHRLHSAGV